MNCLLQDSNDALRIGTAEGLAFFSAGQLKAQQVVPQLVARRPYLDWRKTEMEDSGSQLQITCYR